MGRDFSIGYTDSTNKGVSHIMFQMVKRVSQIEEDDIPSQDKHISIEQLYRILEELKNCLDAVQYGKFKAEFVECFKFYEDDTFEKVFENCERAYEIFTNALIDSVFNKEKTVYWEYS